jgi:hypothetical protein
MKRAKEAVTVSAAADMAEMLRRGGVCYVLLPDEQIVVVRVLTCPGETTVTAWSVGGTSGKIGNQLRGEFPSADVAIAALTGALFV